MDTDDIHSCSFFCTLPACAIRQRDLMRDRIESMDAWDNVLAARWGLTPVAFEGLDHQGSPYLSYDSRVAPLPGSRALFSVSTARRAPTSTASTEET
jgi:hypothetical protein